MSHYIPFYPQMLLLKSSISPDAMGLAEDLSQKWLRNCFEERWELAREVGHGANFWDEKTLLGTG